MAVALLKHSPKPWRQNDSPLLKEKRNSLAFVDCALSTKCVLPSYLQNSHSVKFNHGKRKPHGLVHCKEESSKSFNDICIQPEAQNVNGVIQNVTSPEKKSVLISLPGGGMFFYWQIGALLALEKRICLDDVKFLGASAGALAATLAACNVNGKFAAEKAFQISLDHDLWSRFGGLAGYWGILVRKWLVQLLPENAVDLCQNRLHLYVLELPSIRRRQLGFKRRLISDFKSKEDIIDCCMASVHIPLFMNGYPWTRYDGKRVIDGSILTKSSDFLLDEEHPTLILDYTFDEEMKAKQSKFLDLGGGPTATWSWIEEMMENGYNYVEGLELEGELKHVM